MPANSLVFQQPKKQKLSDSDAHVRIWASVGPQSKIQGTDSVTQDTFTKDIIRLEFYSFVFDVYIESTLFFLLHKLHEVTRT